MASQPDQALPYLDWIDAVVERPHGVEVVLHALLEVLRHRVQDGEVLQLGTHDGGQLRGESRLHELEITQK